MRPGARLVSADLSARLFWWPALAVELERWGERGETPRFWLRDDDAETDGPGLERLLRLTEQHGIPLALAVVPTGTGLARLARRLERATWVEVIQHGTDHRNRRPAGEPSGEFPHDACPREMTQAVHAGATRLRSSFPTVLPVYAPPWNRLQPQLSAALPAAGLRAVSGFGTTGADWHGLRRVDTHADLLRWRPVPAARGEASLARGLLRELRARRRLRQAGRPIGLLTHHRVHDETSWTLLDRLARRLPGRAWEPLSVLLQDPRPV